MGLESVVLLCKDCGEEWDDLVERSERDSLHPCRECGKIAAERVFTAPAVMNTALPDGTKRKGFTEMKEVARLEKEMANKPHNQRKDIKAEIQKLKKL